MPDPSKALAAQALHLLPPGCHGGFADPAHLWPLIAPEVVSGMVPRRAAEFSAGRAAARMALAGLGFPPCAIPQGADRAPVWPADVVGSITHSRAACIAAVSPDLRGLGVDIEPDLPLPPEVAALIRTPADHVDTGLTADPSLLLFCAKEAAYKAQYPSSRRVLGPEAFAVRIEGDDFTARLTEPAPPFATGACITGRITRAADHVLAVAWLR